MVTIGAMPAGIVFEHSEPASSTDGFLVEPISISIEIIFGEIVVPRGEIKSLLVFLVGRLTRLPGNRFDTETLYLGRISIFFRERMAEFMK